MKPLITIHYGDGRNSEEREMTDEEFAVWTDSQGCVSHHIEEIIDQ